MTQSLSNQSQSTPPTTYDLVVIGSGPGGEVAAIRAAQLGLKVALVEKQKHLGGTCLNWGCIPTKALLHAATTYDKLKTLGDQGFEIGNIHYSWTKILERKEKILDQQRNGLRFLMKKNKIDTYEGHGRLSDSSTVTVQASDGSELKIKTKKTLIATGSKVRNLPTAPVDGKMIHNSDTVLSIESVPKSLAVIGGGVVGTEFASLFARFDSKVTILEMAPQILPSEDDESVKELSRHLKKQGIDIRTGITIAEIKTQKSSKSSNSPVTIVLGDGSQIEVDVLLVSVGREPVTSDIGLETVGIKAEKSGHIPVNEHYQTSNPNVFAIGDVIPTPALAHTASAEGMHAAEWIAGSKPVVINYNANPNAIYCYPEIASVGMTEKKLKEKGIEYLVAKFPFAPLAKAKIEGTTDGFVKILYGNKHREILGAHIVHAKATEMIAEFVFGQILETTIDELGLTIHPHPTLSETVMEAAHVAHGGGIHL